MRILQHVLRVKKIASVKNEAFSSIYRSLTFRQKMPPPDRWLDYSNVGKVIPGTNIVCFKVPLKHGLLRQVPPDMWFTPKNLIDHIEKENHKLVMVIDLTFTTKYYFTDDFTTKNGVEHLKVFTEGHVIPGDDIVHRFFDAIETTTKASSSDKVDVIGVHCTHGVNRTGYMVCRYMIERLAFKPEEAIQAFNAARGHDIERENYLDNLRTKTFLEDYKNEGRHRLEQKKPQSTFGSHGHQNRRSRSERSMSKSKDSGDQHSSGGNQDRHHGSYHDNARNATPVDDRYPYGEYTYEVEEGQREMQRELDYGMHSGYHNYHSDRSYRDDKQDYASHEYRGQGRNNIGQGHDYRGQGREGEGQDYGGYHYRNNGYRDQRYERQDRRGQGHTSSWRGDKKRSPPGNWRTHSHSDDYNSRDKRQSHERSDRHGHEKFDSRQSHEMSERRQRHERSDRHNDKYGLSDQTDLKTRNSPMDIQTDHSNTVLQSDGYNSEL
ncbi:pre-mRNA-splicing factor 38B-like [Argopecten irradians]|uniref:pre-mRNA-splicing factor 38B-like n=1 Tax=Argopecten irradians TaxID=31199 RepID=UPI003714309F